MFVRIHHHETCLWSSLHKVYKGHVSCFICFCRRNSDTFSTDLVFCSILFCFITFYNWKQKYFSIVFCIISDLMPFTPSSVCAHPGTWVWHRRLQVWVHPGLRISLWRPHHLLWWPADGSRVHQHCPWQENKVGVKGSMEMVAEKGVKILAVFVICTTYRSTRLS